MGIDRLEHHRIVMGVIRPCEHDHQGGKLIGAVQLKDFRAERGADPLVFPIGQSFATEPQERWPNAEAARLLFTGEQRADSRKQRPAFQCCLSWWSPCIC